MLTLLALDIGNTLKTVVGIGGLIFVHELGHFLVGRWCGVRAEAFSIGFGPVLAKWTPGETEYRLSAIPLGGYVKFLGENPDERGELDPRSFHAATYPRKAAIMLAGVTMNVIAAFLLFVAAFSAGVTMTAPVVGTVVAGMPAERAGIRVGDRVVEIDGKRILDFGDISQEVGFTDRVEVVVERDGRRLAPLSIETETSPSGVRVIGIAESADESGVVFPVPGSPAERAGFRPLDRVLAVDGRPVADFRAAWDAHAAIGRPAKWTVRRGDADAEVEVPSGVWRIGLVAARGPAPAGPPDGNGLAVTLPEGAAPSAARDAGLPPAFRILTIDGAPVSAMEHVQRATAAAGPAGAALRIRWTAADGGELKETEVRPRLVAAASADELGIARPLLTDVVRETNVAAAAVLGVERTHRWVMRILTSVRALVTGQVSAKLLQGPIKLARETYRTADSGWTYLAMFLGIISMNLAVLNVLPVPLLDGGQLAILTVEKVRGKPLPGRLLEAIQWTGLALLLAFMLFLVVNDLRTL